MKNQNVSNQPVQNRKKVTLPFPIPSQSTSLIQQQESGQQTDETLTHERLRPKPTRYADRTWMPPRNTRRSMGKR